MSSAPSFQARDRRDTTFKGALGQPIHRWFTITPSYAPELVADCASHLELRPGEQALDPFVGTGTTAVWCRLANQPCTGLEWNPALAFIAATKAGWRAPADAFQAAALTFSAAWKAEAAPLDDEASARAYLAQHADDVPRIAHPQRWWTMPGLATLTAARRLLATIPAHDPCRDGLRLALLRVLLPASRARYNHASVSFDREASLPSPVGIVALFEQAADMLATDLRATADQPQRLATIRRANAINLAAALPAGAFDCLICSPPYPNRYSYARETRPHLYFLGLVDNASAVGTLEVEAMGGTWGKATWMLSQHHEPEPSVVAPLMATRLPAMRQAHPLMANYGVRYLNDLWRHVQGLNTVMAPHARVAYVIGNSKLGGVEFPAAEWLLALLAAAGWRPIGQGVHPMRRRNSRAGLVESVVFAERG